MPPHRNPLEQRSAKYAPRQYVSKTHDHKPDAPQHRAPAEKPVMPIDQEQPYG